MLQGQLALEVLHIRRVRPDIVAVVDGAVDNWTFPETLSPDSGGDRLLPCVRASEDMADKAVARDWYDRGRKVLRDDPKVLVGM